MPNSDWDRHVTETGKTYYHNRKTGESSWELPVPQRTDPPRNAWEALWSEEHRMHYFYNRETGETRWENPNGSARESQGSGSSATASVASPEQPREEHHGNRVHHPEGRRPYATASVANVGPQLGAGQHAWRDRSPPFYPTGPNTQARYAGVPGSGQNRQDAEGPQYMDPRLANGEQRDALQHPYDPFRTGSTFDQAVSFSRRPNAEPAGSTPDRIPVSIPAPAARPSTRKIPVSPYRDKKAELILKETMMRREESLRRLEKARESARARVEEARARHTEMAKGKGEAEPAAERPTTEVLQAAADGVSGGRTSGEGQAGDPGGNGGVILMNTAEAVVDSPNVGDSEERAVAEDHSAAVANNQASVAAGTDDSQIQAQGQQLEGEGERSDGGDQMGATEVRCTFSESGDKDDAIESADSTNVAGIGDDPNGWVVVGAADMSWPAGDSDAHERGASALPTLSESPGALEDDARGAALLTAGGDCGVDHAAGDSWQEEGGDEQGGVPEAEQQEVEAGWTEVELHGAEADEEVAAVSTTKSTAGRIEISSAETTTAVEPASATSVSDPPEPDSAEEVDVASPGDLEENSGTSPALLTRAMRRVTRLLELLGSVGGERAWARWLRENDHVACSRLVDYLALGCLHLEGVAGTGISLLGGKPSRDQSETAGSTSAPPGLKDESRSLCRSALACLGICGRICPGMWTDLARTRQDGEQCADGSAVDESKLVQALSFCAALATRNGEGDGEGDGEGGGTATAAAASGRVGVEVEEYRWRGKYESPNGDNIAQPGGGEVEDTAQEIKMMALIVMFEAFTGCIRKGVKALGQWKDMGALLRSLMDIIFHAEEGCYLQATKVLLVANDPFFREPTVASSDPPSTAQPCPESSVIPALQEHPASHEVQGAVLHILNEEGYPNGDPGLARLCLGFCVDALQARSQGAELFYVNDIKVMVDVIIREVHNLPEDHLLRPQFRHVLRRLVTCSEWATRGERYRGQDLERALRIAS